MVPVTSALIFYNSNIYRTHRNIVQLCKTMSLALSVVITFTSSSQPPTWSSWAWIFLSPAQVTPLHRSLSHLTWSQVQLLHNLVASYMTEARLLSNLFAASPLDDFSTFLNDQWKECRLFSDKVSPLKNWGIDADLLRGLKKKQKRQKTNNIYDQ